MALGRLAVEQRSEKQQCLYGNQRLLTDRHRPAGFFIQHPRRQDHLVAVRQLHLHLVGAKVGATPHQLYRITKVGEMGIVDSWRA